MGKQGKRGSVLILALILFLILISLSVAIISHESIARRIFIRTRLQGLESETVDTAVQKFKGTFSGETPIPDGCPSPTGEFVVESDSEKSVEVKGKFAADGSVYNPPPKDFGKDYKKVPLVGYFFDKDKLSSEEITSREGFRNIQVPPWHNMAVFKTQTDRSYIAIFSDAFPYAAYAPKGSITLMDAAGAANPTMAFASEEMDKEENKEKDLTDMYSGVPVKLYAKNDITLKSFPHGRAYSENGPITFQEKTGGIGFSQVKPEKDFTVTIKSQLDDTYKELTKDVLDKTYFITGRPLRITTLITGGAGLKDIFSIEQSLEFPLPIIPTFSTLGAVHTIQFHCPFISDIANVYGPPHDPNSSSDADLNKLAQVAKGILNRLGYSPAGVKDGEKYYTKAQLEKAQGELDKILSNFNSAMSKAGFPAQDAYIAQAKQKLQQMNDNVSLGYISKYEQIIIKKQNYDDYGKYLQLVGQMDQNANTDPAAARTDVPESREQESKFTNPEPSYPFGSLGKNLWNSIWGLFKNLFKGNFSGAAESFMQTFHAKLRVVHFSYSSKKSPSYAKGGFISFTRESGVGGATTGFSIKSSWTVPKGRTLKLKTDVTINGDLWIQDGGLLYVEGNLTLANPSSGITINPMTPTGRLILGKGSSLVVSGNLTCGGTPQYGSIFLLSSVGKVPSLTAGVFCKGETSIPYGVLPALSFEEIADWIGNDTLETFIGKAIDYGPTVSKVAGPFHRRNPCYFALHPATFRIIQVFYVPIIFPSPTTTKNMLISIYKYVSLFYSVELNAFLGEYLFTQTDWWSAVFGEGVIPAVPKLDAEATLAAFKNIGSIASAQDLKDIAMNIVQKVTEQLFIELGTAIVTNIAATIITYVVTNLVGLGETGGIIDMLMEKAFGIVSKMLESQWGISLTGGADSIQDAILNTFKNALSNAFQTAVDMAKAQLTALLNQYVSKLIIFNEVPGVLVYSGEKLTMGGYAASGLFICKNDLEISTARVVGCLMSLEKSVVAPNCRLRYYPYFTRASIYMPEKKGLFSNLITFEPPVSGNTPKDIGVQYNHILTEGWSKQ